MEDVREGIISIICPFYEDCTYRLEGKCWTLGQEWCACKSLSKVDRILTYLRGHNYRRVDPKRLIEEVLRLLYANIRGEKIGEREEAAHQICQLFGFNLKHDASSPWFTGSSPEKSASYLLTSRGMREIKPCKVVRIEA